MNDVKLKYLFDKQESLDNTIVHNLNVRLRQKNSTAPLVTHKQLINQRMLSIFVEFGEFREEANREKKLEEMSDVLHFVLSAALTLGLSKYYSNLSVQDIYMELQEKLYQDAEYKFYQDLYKFVNKSRVFKYWSSNLEQPENLHKLWFKVFKGYLALGKALDYSIEDIVRAYEVKHKINMERQDSNY